MSVSKTFLLAGAAAFVSSAALAGGHIPLRASDVVGFKGVAVHQQLAPPALVGVGWRAIQGCRQHSLRAITGTVQRCGD